MAKIYLQEGENPVNISNGAGDQTIYSKIGSNLQLKFDENSKLSFTQNLKNADLVITNTYTDEAGNTKSEKITLKDYYIYVTNTKNKYAIDENNVHTIIKNTGLTIIGQPKKDNIFLGTTSDDIIYAGNKDNDIETGDGNDIIYFTSKSEAKIKEKSGNDTYVFTGLGAEVEIADRNGNDTIKINKIKNTDVNLMFEVNADGSHVSKDDGKLEYDLVIANNKNIKRLLKSDIDAGIEIEDYFKADSHKIENLVITDKSGKVTSEIGSIDNWIDAITTDVQTYITSLNNEKFQSAFDILEKGSKSQKKALLNLYQNNKLERLYSGDDTITVASGKNKIYTGEGTDKVVLLNGVSKNTITTGKAETSSTTIEFETAKDYTYSKSAKSNDLVITRTSKNAKGKTVSEVTTIKDYFAEDNKSTLSIKNGDNEAVIVKSDLDNKLTITGLAKKSNTIKGTDTADYIVGGKKADTIYANGGNDIISAGKGNDIIYAGEGEKSILINNGDGTDTIYLGKDKDTYTSIYYKEGNNLSYNVDDEGDLLINHTYKSGKKYKTETTKISDYANLTSQLNVQSINSNENLYFLNYNGTLTIKDEAGDDTYVINSAKDLRLRDDKGNDTYIVNNAKGINIYDDDGDNDTLIINDKTMKVSDMRLYVDVRTNGEELTAEQDQYALIYNQSNFNNVISNINTEAGMAGEEYGIEIEHYFAQDHNGKIENVSVYEDGQKTDLTNFDGWVNIVVERVKKAMEHCTEYNSSHDLIMDFAKNLKIIMERVELDPNQITDATYVKNTVAEAVKNNFSLITDAEFKSASIFLTKYESTIVGILDAFKTEYADSYEPVDNVYKTSSDFDFTKDTLIINDFGGDDILNLDQSKNNLYAYMNISKDGNWSDLQIVKKDGMNLALGTGVKIYNQNGTGCIETITTSDGYELSDTAINEILQNVAGFFETHDGYNSTDEVLASGNLADMGALAMCYINSSGSALWEQPVEA